MQKYTLKLAKELKKFFSQEIHNFVYENGRELKLDDKELDECWEVVNETIKELGGDFVSSFPDPALIEVEDGGAPR